MASLEQNVGLVIPDEVPIRESWNLEATNKTSGIGQVVEVDIVTMKQIVDVEIVNNVSHAGQNEAAVDIEVRNETVDLETEISPEIAN